MHVLTATGFLATGGGCFDCTTATSTTGIVVVDGTTTGVVDGTTTGVVDVVSKVALLVGLVVVATAVDGMAFAGLASDVDVMDVMDVMGVMGVMGVVGVVVWKENGGWSLMFLPRQPVAARAMPLR